MFVVVDIERAVNSDHHQCVTQIAATKVDKKWRAYDSYFSLVRPQDASFHNWKQPCYNGDRPQNFLSARSVFAVLEEFFDWIGEDAILLFWQKRDCVFFHIICKILFKKTIPNMTIPIVEYVTSILGTSQNDKAGAYALAKYERVLYPTEEHFAANDVRVMLLLLRKAGMAPDMFLAPPPRRSDTRPDTPYLYDKTAELLHISGCSAIPMGHVIRGLSSIKTCIANGYQACPVCIRDMKRFAKRVKNADTIHRSAYHYLYSDRSNVFHFRDCGVLLSIQHSLQGVSYYETAIKKGLRPCKICNPAPIENLILSDEVASKEDIAPVKLEKKRRVVTPESRALNRQCQAQKERKEALNAEGLTNQERKDIYMLTQPEYAFWAATGYKTFHMRQCPKLDRMSDYKGFKTYSQAKRAGYQPCKICKPTPKQDVILSIPIYNEERTGEGKWDIFSFCHREKYIYMEKGDIVTIITPAGEWRLHPKNRPITVEHKNLILGGGFHQQPRLFLSLHDMFLYIDRHDKELLQKAESLGEKKLHIPQIKK